MSKKAILAIFVALFIPILSYFLLKGFGERAVHMPNRYLPDSVSTYIKDGKTVNDTVWHTVRNISLTNQLGKQVSLHDIQGKIIVLDVFFTSCGSICPALTRNMSKMQKSFLKGGNTRQKIDTSLVHFVSLTIDPKRDSVPRLKAYADAYGVVHDNWWMLTGEKDSIYNFIFEELKVDKYDPEMEVTPDFPHTGRFVLIDKNFNVRGYYNGLDTLESLPKMARDIGLLMVEKDRKNPPALPFDPIIMGLFFVIALIAVLLIGRKLFRNKEEKQTTD